MNTSLNSNSIAFIGLCNEFCIAVENARESQRDEFLDTMLHLLPRIYIAATDLRTVPLSFDDTYIERVLEEDYYESVRRSMEGLFGEYDVYLEVFEEDMKYSDTPVAASISEGLADISRCSTISSIPSARPPTRRSMVLSPLWPMISATTGALRSAMCSALSIILK